MSRRFGWIVVLIMAGAAAPLFAADENPMPVEPIVLVLRPAGDGSCAIWLDHAGPIPDDGFDRLRTTLEGWRIDAVGNPDGLYDADTPVIIRADPELRWKHVAAALNAVAAAKFSNVRFAQAEAGANPLMPEARLLSDEPADILVYDEQVEPADAAGPRNVPRPPGEVTAAEQPATIGVAGENAMPIGVAGAAPGDGPAGPAEIFNVGRNTRSVVYVVDASGSLVDTMPFVIDGLQRSIGKLDEQQRFAVLFFQRGMVIEVPVPSRGLKPATAAAREAAADWIDLANGNIVPRGTSDPVPAIRLAVAYKPDEIVLLSDNITGKGRHAIEQADLLAAIQAETARRGAERTKISTIQFLQPDALGTMEKIAEQYGGTYRFIDRAALTE